MREKLFLEIQSINIMYPNVENLVVVPKMKRMEIIMSIQVCLISRMNINYSKNGGNKSFSCQTKTSIPSISLTKHDCNAHSQKKKIKIIRRIQVCLIWRLNFDYKENIGKNNFSCQTKASIPIILMRRTCLWCLIMKKMEILLRIQVCLI